MNFFLLRSLLCSAAVHLTFAISCYNYMWDDGENNVTASKIDFCSSCAKMMMVYSIPGQSLKTFHWSCLNNTEHLGSTPFSGGNQSPPSEMQCLPTSSAVAYNDGTMFSMSCTCCEDNCNGDPHFCAADLATCVGVKVPNVVHKESAIELSENNGSIAIRPVANMVAAPALRQTALENKNGTESEEESDNSGSQLQVNPIVPIVLLLALVAF